MVGRHKRLIEGILVPVPIEAAPVTPVFLGKPNPAVIFGRIRTAVGDGG